jgi:geranylgeranyl pyrophosphate synthase
MDQILVYGPAVQTELRAYIRAKRHQAGQSAWMVDFLNRLEPFSTSGKLLRGNLLCLSFEMFSQQPPDKTIIKAAVALEMTHSALLIHDDIMDGDDRRRGQPSLHRQYQLLAKNEKLAASPQLGLNLALSAGDAALFLAFELLNQARTSRGLNNELYELYVNQLIMTCEGQMQDVYLEAQPKMPPKKTIYDLMAAKTAGYTMVLPLTMGALLANQPAEVRRRLGVIGLAMGIIFQIRDDELGVMGSTQKTGKPVGADIKQGKKTLLHYYLLKSCPPGERAKIQSIFGNPAITAQDIKYIQRLVEKAGIADKLGAEINRLKNNAFEEIDNLPLTDDAKSKLKQLTDFCAERQF